MLRLCHAANRERRPPLIEANGHPAAHWSQGPGVEGGCGFVPATVKIRRNHHRSKANRYYMHGIAMAPDNRHHISENPSPENNESILHDLSVIEGAH